MTNFTPEKLFALVLLAPVLAGVWQGLSTLNRDMAFTAVQTEVSFWGRASYQPTAATIARTDRDIHQLTAVSVNPEHLALQAAYASWRGFWAENAVERGKFATMAVNSQYQALQSRPAHRHSWTKMVKYSSRDVRGAAFLAQAQARLAALQPSR